MLLSRDREKLFNALIYFNNSVLHAGKTKLFKLLYFLDFMHFQQTGRSVTGLQYFAWERGPVPKELQQEIKKPTPEFIAHFFKKKRPVGAFTREELVARKQFDEDVFTPFQLKLMEKLAKEHFRHTADEMSEKTHFETGPWHEVWEVQDRKSDHIPYELALLRRGNEEDMAILEVANEYQELINNYK